jgi:hypothetical protein
MTSKKLFIAGIIGLTTLFSTMASAMMPNQNHYQYPSANYAHYQQPYPMRHHGFRRPHYRGNGYGYGYGMRPCYRAPGVAIIRHGRHVVVRFGNGHRY